MQLRYKSPMMVYSWDVVSVEPNFLLEKTDNKATSSAWIQDAKLHICNTKTHLCLAPASLMVLKNAHRYPYCQLVNEKEKHAARIATFCKHSLQVSLCPWSVHMAMKSPCPNITLTSLKRQYLQTNTHAFLKEPFHIQ